MPFLTSGDEDMKTMKPPRSSSSWLSYLSLIPSNSVGILALTECCWRRWRRLSRSREACRLINIWLLPRHHDWSIPETCSRRSHFVSFVVVVAMLQFPMRDPKWWWWWSCKAPPFQQSFSSHAIYTWKHTGSNNWNSCFFKRSQVPKWKLFATVLHNK